MADVPVGVFLSGGIDSGALVGLMRDAGQCNIQAVTLAFGEFRGPAEDEAPLADEVARLYGARHTTRVVTLAEFEADLPRIIEAMDQPSIDGVNTWFVSKAARELGLKVALSGLGEGFGIAFIEAAASGVPVIGGNRDGSVDALADGQIGRLVDPHAPAEIEGAVIDALLGRPPVPAGVEETRRFAFARFAAHVDALAGTLAR